MWQKDSECQMTCYFMFGVQITVGLELYLVIAFVVLHMLVFDVMADIIICTTLGRLHYNQN